MLMKNLIFAAIVTTSLFSSCSGSCDTSTAEGAANCLCELTDESVVLDQADDAKAKELSDKIEKIKDEIEKAIEADKYTKEQLGAITSERSCMQIIL